MVKIGVLLGFERTVLVNRIALAALAIVALLGACTARGGTVEPTALRLGYFPNVTHATAIVGLQQGLFAKALGPGMVLEPKVFNAGGEAVEAIFSGALDASYMGPNPTINAFTKSDGEAIRIVAGATSGGAALVVRDGIDAPADLAGARLASPALGNTQDVALRAWLADQGFAVDAQGAGDVSVLPQANGDTLTAFVTGQIDGAWVPEPWATRLQAEGGGHVLVDERDLWPDGKFVTTQLVVSRKLLEEHPEIVRQLLVGHVAANDFIADHPAESQEIVAEAIADMTGAEIPAGAIARAWPTLTFTNDPIASSLVASARDALAFGFLDAADLDGIYDLTLLNAVLADAGQDPIAQP
jgi:NitT/TauT family transport system substrate-binding protein